MSATSPRTDHGHLELSAQEDDTTATSSCTSSAARGCRDEDCTTGAATASPNDGRRTRRSQAAQSEGPAAPGQEPTRQGQEAQAQEVLIAPLWGLFYGKVPAGDLSFLNEKDPGFLLGLGARDSTTLHPHPQPVHACISGGKVKASGYEMTRSLSFNG